MAEQREQFLLAKSAEFSIATGAEVRSDVTIVPNPDVNKSVIICTVLSASIPVVNAMVKILTPVGNPIDHQFTNPLGQTTSNPIVAGVYIVVVTAPNFITSLPVTVNLAGTTSSFVNISLIPDPRAQKNTIYGLVLDQITGMPVINASVYLNSTLDETVALTTSDSDGEYLLYEVANGSYTISAQKQGYMLPAPLSVIVSGAQIAQANILIVAEIITNGTVQGFIKDPSGNLLGGAFVGLYTVAGEVESLIMETFTNAIGFYLFGNVVAGNYLVKAKLDIKV